MPPRVPGTALALPAALILVLTASGCGGKDGSPVPAPSTTPSTAPVAPETTPAAPASTATSAATGPVGSPSGTCTETRGLTDGSWSGPVTMDVDGKGGTAAFTSTPGRGTLSLVVAGGRVTAATWNVRWTSHGHAETGNASADLDVVGTIRGTASGRATAPRLSGTWRIKGTAMITEPVRSSAPVDDSGPDTGTLTLRRTTGCGTRIAGSFVSSFTSKDAAATFRGKARWRGTRS